jgi:hypothetical protein
VEELKVLCDARVHTAIKTMGIELCSFANFPRVPSPSQRQEPT